MNVGEIISCEFCRYQIEIDGFRLGEIERALDSAVEECAVEGRMGFENSAVVFSKYV